VVLVGVAISFYAPAYGLGWFVDAVLLAIAARFAGRARIGALACQCVTHNEEA